MAMSQLEFSESLYLAMHADVRQAVAEGLLESGYEHYQKFGRAEGRQLRRFNAAAHSIRDYTALVKRLIAEHPGDLDLAMAKAVGAHNLEIFQATGDKHVYVLQSLGLKPQQQIYDLACGCGRTAAALRRHGWSGSYRGADIIPDLLQFASQQNPGFQFIYHPDYSICADDESLDIVFSWSLFTHLYLEEIYLYAQDSYRALKPGGLFVFSFLSLDDKQHREIFMSRVETLNRGENCVHLDTFLEQTTIVSLMTQMLGFKLQAIYAADDDSVTPAGRFGQALAVFRK